jgi:hypothetical protein
MEGKVEMIRMEVDMKNILLQAAKECRNPVISIAMSMIMTSMITIAKEALKTDNEVIKEELRVLGIIKIA